MDDAVAGFARSREIRAREDCWRNLFEAASDGSGVKDRVASIGNGEQVGGRQQSLGKLTEIAVERRDVKRGLARCIGDLERFSGQKFFGETIERSVFGGFVEKRVADV